MTSLPQPRPLIGFIFDLDDTLCAERDYIRSGFAHIARLIGESGPHSADEVERFLLHSFESGVRGNSFDLLLQQFPDLALKFDVAGLVKEYREHAPDVAVDPELFTLLQWLRANGARIGVITDGPVCSQRAKFQALKLGPLVEVAIFNDEFGIQFRKPHERAFQQVELTFELPAAQCVYVGDNPVKDFHAPRKLGWHSVRLRQANQLRFDLQPPSLEYAPDIEMTSAALLADYLRRCRELARRAEHARSTH